MTGMRIRAFEAGDTEWVDEMLARELGSRWQARRGELVDVLSFDGLVAVNDERGVGYLSYRRDGKECELVALVASPRRLGAGTALIEGLKQHGWGAKRIWLVTTNDNLDALRFYQRRGFRLTALRPGAVDAARKQLKPQIPPTGAFGIPLRDELELELRLS
jgi:ribosomal protein S18 acetylase RimI-like enzyme